MENANAAGPGIILENGIVICEHFFKESRAELRKLKGIVLDLPSRDMDGCYTVRCKIKDIFISKDGVAMSIQRLESFDVYYCMGVVSAALHSSEHSSELIDWFLNQQGKKFSLKLFSAMQIQSNEYSPEDILKEFGVRHIKFLFQSIDLAKKMLSQSNYLLDKTVIFLTKYNS